MSLKCNNCNLCYLLLAVTLIATFVSSSSGQRNAPQVDHGQNIAGKGNVRTEPDPKERVRSSETARSQSTTTSKPISQDQNINENNNAADETIHVDTDGHWDDDGNKVIGGSKDPPANSRDIQADKTLDAERSHPIPVHEGIRTVDDVSGKIDPNFQEDSIDSPSKGQNQVKNENVPDSWEDSFSYEAHVEKSEQKHIDEEEQEELPADAMHLEAGTEKSSIGKDELSSPPPVLLTEKEREALEQKKKVDDTYHEGMKLINSSSARSSIAKGYQLLHDAASMGHADAEVEIGFAHLGGALLPMQVSTAKEIFMKHAEMGNPRAQAGLGLMYGTGLGTNSSQAKSLVYLTFSALGNDIMGRMMLGYRYWAGIAVSKSCETALNHYRRVAEKVAANVKLTGGPLLMRVRLIDEADRPGSNYGMIDDDLVQYYQFLADKGDAPAQVTLGQLNYQGSQGFEQNQEKAFDYFNRAAEGGNANAQGYLGKIFVEGSDKVKANNETALKYFKLAAAQGNAIGQAGLGLMYLYGKGVKIDYDKAFKNFQASADQGWPEGQLYLGNMYFHGLGTARDYKHALRCFNLAAQNGHLLALYYLAKMHATGTGVVRSCQTAVELYKNVCERGRWSSQFELAHRQYKDGRVDSALSIYLLLAELGYEVAQSNVAYILDQEQSNLVPNQTFARALVHWDRAAEQGYSIARIKLGDYHYYGKGTEVDYEIAASHYKVATEQNNNAQAMFNLGYMHEQGLGMERDIHLAKRHYDMAADASADAFAPVSLALIKIGFLFAIDYLQNQRWFHSGLSKVSPYLSDNWDLYLMTVLALLLGFVVAFRRQRR